jgi:cold shock CspA family protein
MRGKMLWFNNAQDHGLIMTDEGERLAVLGSGFAGGARPLGRCAEAVVTFEVSDSDGTRHAANVEIEPELAPARRARLRSGGFRR